MKIRRPPLLLLAVVLVLTGAGLYRGLAPALPQTTGDPILHRHRSRSAAHWWNSVPIPARPASPCNRWSPNCDHPHAGRLEVVSINLLRYPEQAKVWQVKFIPTQVFLDGQGRELFRHVGYLPRQAVEERFAALGFPLAPQPATPASGSARE